MQKGFIDQFGNYSPEETVLLVVSIVLSFVGFVLLLGRVELPRFGGHRLHRLPFYASVLAGFALLGIAIRWGAAKDVRENPAYLLLMLLMAGAWLTLTALFFSVLGISLRNDAFERRNFAAVLALGGAVFGLMLVCTGSNLGEGPSFLNNVFCCALGIAAWLALWLGLELGAGVSRSVAEERDVAGGMRLAGFLIAEGAVLGRAVAGDWHSAWDTILSFVSDGWPAIVLLVLAIVAERALRPGPANARPSWRSRGLPFLVFYPALALAWLGHLGWWEGAPI